MIYYSNSNLIIKDIETEDPKLRHDFPYSDENPATEDRLDVYLKDTSEGVHKTIVAIQNGKLAGYLNVCPKGTSWHDRISENNDTFLYDLYVIPEFRRCGIGEKLLSAAESIAKNTTDAMWLYVQCENEVAQDFYKKNGFRQADNFFYYCDKPYKTREALVEENRKSMMYDDEDMTEYKYLKFLK